MASKITVTFNIRSQQMLKNFASDNFLGCVIREIGNVSDKHRSAYFKFLSSVLLDTKDIFTRNAAVISLGDLFGKQASPIIIQALQNTHFYKQNGTLIYILNDLKIGLPLPMIINLFVQGSWEVRHELAEMIEGKCIEPFTKDELNAGVEELTRFASNYQSDAILVNFIIDELRTIKTA